MADQTEVIRKQMEETRSDLESKLEALESKVANTVQSATEVVSETVQSAKEAVSDTVETVKETVSHVTEAVGETVHNVGELFDLRVQADRHPWMVVGGAVALGFTVAQVLPSARSEGEASYASWNENAASGRQSAMSMAAERPAGEQRTGWLWDEFGKLKGLALGAVLGVVRDLVKRNVPGEIGERIAEEVDNFTTKMGAQPFHGSLFGEQEK
jgi:ElaB/YqjD/DUF883 family membrane-anchored ribosome-binding protein